MRVAISLLIGLSLASPARAQPKPLRVLLLYD